MAWFPSIRGTVQRLFQIGPASGGSPNLRSQVTGELEVRDAADAAFENLRVADAVIDDDAVTLRQLNASAGGDANYIRVTAGTATVVSGTSVPAGARILGAGLFVSTGYSVGATLTVGTTANPTAAMVTTDSDPQTIGTYGGTPLDVLVPVASPLQVTVGGAPAAGAASAWIAYATPLV